MHNKIIPTLRSRQEIDMGRRQARYVDKHQGAFGKGSACKVGGSVVSSVSEADMAALQALVGVRESREGVFLPRSSGNMPLWAAVLTFAALFSGIEAVPLGRRDGMPDCHPLLGMASLNPYLNATEINRCFSALPPRIVGHEIDPRQVVQQFGAACPGALPVQRLANLVNFY